MRKYVEIILLIVILLCVIALNNMHNYEKKLKDEQIKQLQINCNTGVNK